MKPTGIAIVLAVAAGAAWPQAASAHSAAWFSNHPKALSAAIARCAKTQAPTPNCHAAATAMNHRLLNPRNTAVPSLTGN